jgi:hypothetical protein
MKVCEVASIIKEKFPSLLTQTPFTPPLYRCTRWLLIRGPSYGDSEFRGALLVDATELLGWAAHHAQACWSTDEADQQARVFLPEWLREANVEDESTTLLGREFRGVLGPYAQNFLDFSQTRIYCPDCNFLQSEVVVLTGKADKKAARMWLREWTCPLGHVVRKERIEPMSVMGIQSPKDSVGAATSSIFNRGVILTLMAMLLSVTIIFLRWK